MILIAYLSSYRNAHIGYIFDLSCEYSNCKIELQVTETVEIIIHSETENIDRINEIFFRLFEILQICLGYFFNINKIIMDNKEIIYNEEVQLPLKYQSPQLSVLKYKHLIVINQDFNISNALETWEKLRKKSMQTIDVYYTSVSVCNLYPEAKLSLLIQSLEGFGKLNLEKSKMDLLSKKDASNLRTIAKMAISNSVFFIEECTKLNIEVDTVATIMYESMNHFNDATLRNIIKALFETNEITNRILNLGDMLKDNGKGIDLIKRTINHRNYFAHLTDDKVRFDGRLSNAAILLYDMLFRIIILHQMKLNDLINVSSFTQWENTVKGWINTEINIAGNGSNQ